MLYNEKRPDAMPAVAMAPGDTPCAARPVACGYTGGRSRLRRRRRARLLHHADWIAFLLHGEMGVTDHNNALKLGFDPAGEGRTRREFVRRAVRVTHCPPVLPPGRADGGVGGGAIEVTRRVRRRRGHDRLRGGVRGAMHLPRDCVTSLG